MRDFLYLVACFAATFLKVVFVPAALRRVATRQWWPIIRSASLIASSSFTRFSIGVRSCLQLKLFPFVVAGVNDPGYSYNAQDYAIGDAITAF
jgi:hypothetical protein